MIQWTEQMMSSSLGIVIQRYLPSTGTKTIVIHYQFHFMNMQKRTFFHNSSLFLPTTAFRMTSPTTIPLLFFHFLITTAHNTSPYHVHFREYFLCFLFTIIFRPRDFSDCENGESKRWAFERMKAQGLSKSSPLWDAAGNFSVILKLDFVVNGHRKDFFRWIEKKNIFFVNEKKSLKRKKSRKKTFFYSCCGNKHKDNQIQK